MDTVVAGWRVTQVQSHPEFQRFSLTHGAGQTAVEVVAHRGPVEAWSTARHRLQPAPGEQPPEPLLLALLADLRRWESQQAEALVTVKARPAPWRGMRTVDVGFALADALFLLLALALSARWLRDRRALWPWTAAALLLVAAVTALVFGRLGPHDLPLQWLTPLHEGTTGQAVEILHGRNRHAGPHLDFLHWLAADTPALGLRHAVRANLWFSGLDLALLLVVARAAAGSAVPALLLVAAFALAAPGRLAALSEIEAPATTALLLLMLPAGALLAERGPRPWRTLACLHLVLGTVLVGLVRVELAGIGLVALLAAGLGRHFTDAGLRERMVATWQRIRAWPRQRVALLGLGLLASLALLWLPTRLAWLVAGVHPANPSILTLPAMLVALLPPGVVLLALLGLGDGLRRPLTWLGLPLAAVVLYRVYFCASHRVFYEMVRYLAALWPVLLLLAALGWRVVARHLAAQPPALRQKAWALLAILLLVPPLPVTAGLFWDWQPGALPLVGLLQTDHQREARFLLETAEAHPDCVLVTRVTAEAERVDAPQRYDYALFGQPLRAPLRVPAQGDPAAVALRHVPAARCALFVRALDCHLQAGQPCDAEARGRPMERVERFASRPYNDAYEYGATRDAIELATFRLR